MSVSPESRPELNFTVYLRNELLRRFNPPVIIIGMHRSGTSLVTRLLETCGLFLGSDLDPNHESIFFQNINVSLLKEAGADWSQNQPFQEKLKQSAFFNRQADFMRRQIQAELFRYFFKSRLQFKFLNKHEFQWGWKDPRNSLTLPLWLKLFPDARIVHVVRNGIDSALSLLHREQTLPSELSRNSSHPDTVFCFKIWEEYVNACLKFSSQRHYYEIRYEQLLKTPRETLESLINFLHLTASANSIEQAITLVTPRTAEQHELSKLNHELQAAAANSNLMYKLGYLTHER